MKSKKLATGIVLLSLLLNVQVKANAVEFVNSYQIMRIVHDAQAERNILKQNKPEIWASKSNPVQTVKPSIWQFNNALELINSIPITYPMPGAFHVGQQDEITAFSEKCTPRLSTGLDCEELIKLNKLEKFLPTKKPDLYDNHEISIDSKGNHFLLEYPVKLCSDYLEICKPYVKTKPKYFFDCKVVTVSPRGEILNSWSASKFLSPKDIDAKTYENEFPLGEFQDPFHCNSVSPIAETKILLSLRNTNALYLIDMASGNVAWKIGGRYQKGVSLPIINLSKLEGSQIKAQHDFRYWGNNTFSFFDNQSDNNIAARGVVFKLLQSNKKTYAARILLTLKNPEGQSSKCMGSTRKISSGWIVGWGCSNLGATLFGFDGNQIVSVGLNNEFNRTNIWNGAVSSLILNDLNSRFYTLMSYRFETNSIINQD